MEGRQRELVFFSLFLLLSFVFAEKYDFAGFKAELDPRTDYSTGDLVVPVGFPIGSTLQLSSQQTTNRSLLCNDLLPNEKIDHSLGTPSFIYVGTAKGGSTSLSKYLPKHPNIGEIPTKEPNFFSFPWVFKLNPTKYGNFFPLGGKDFISGEYSTSYIQHPIAPRHIKTELPHVKIIMFLRNPIDRAYSHFVMQKRSGLEIRSFERIVEIEMQELKGVLQLFRNCFNQKECHLADCIEKEDVTIRSHKTGEPLVIQNKEQIKNYMFTSYLARSIYYDQVERYFALFPRDQILIVESDEFYDNTQSVLDSLTDFLDVPRHSFSDVLDKSWGGGASNSHSPHDYQPLHESTREILQDFFAPYNELLFTLLGNRFAWSK